MNNRKNGKIIALTAAVLGFAAAITGFLGNAGSIEYRFEPEFITVHTKLWKDIEIRYDEISDAQIIDSMDYGKRTNGYGSSKLNLGSFRNEQYGDYLLYCHTGCYPLVQIRMNDGPVIVLGGKDKAETESVLENIRRNTKNTSAGTGIGSEAAQGDKEESVSCPGNDCEPVVLGSMITDFDNDGEDEYIEVTPGPTSGLLTIRVMVKDGGKSFSNFFEPSVFSGSFSLSLIEEDGGVYIDLGEDGKYALSLENGKVVLTNGTEKMAYWGS